MWYCLRWSFIGTNWLSFYEDFKAKYPDAIVSFMLYEGIVHSVRHYQAKLGLEFEENCNINEAYDCMEMHTRRRHQAQLYEVCQKRRRSFEMHRKWSHKHNIHIDTGTIFRHIIKTTQDTHLRWFQYRLVYIIFAFTALFLFLGKLLIQYIL